MKLKCDKCESTRVIEFSKNPPKEPEPKLMSKYVEENGQPRFMPYVNYIAHNVVLCQDCGYRLEYSY